MSERKPPPRTLAPEEERKIQTFLERAAPIVLQCSVVDSAAWERLAELADELGLTADQLKDTIHDLRQRGVIEKVDIRPPKPPPLPPATATAAESPVASVSSREETAEFDERFSLSAPPPLPKARPKTEPPEPSVSAAARRAEFAARARQIIAKHRGLGPQSQTLLAAAANELGIPEEDVQALVRGDQANADEDDATGDPRLGFPEEDDLAASKRWRVEGQPPPEPPPAKKKPCEVFQEYVEQSLDRCVGEVPEEIEKRIVRHGMKVLKLARVYSRHMLHEAARRRDLGLASQQTDSKSASPREQAFRDRAASILAEHRGINAKSRVLLSALASELGLSTGEADVAVASLQGAAAGGSEEERMQAERLAEFRRHADIAMEKLPRGILLPNTHELLVEQGHERYGVDREAVPAAVRELAAGRSLTVISRDQARQHIGELVDRMLEGGLRVTAEARDQVLSEAAQWGVTPEEAEQIIQSTSRRNYQRKRSTQKLVNGALMTGACAVTLLVAFIGWTLMADVAPTPTENPERAIAERVRETLPSKDQDSSWWSDELSLALAECRLEFVGLRPTLEEIRSTNAGRRAAAYERVVQHALDLDGDDTRRSLFLACLSHCYALDPNDSAAERLAHSLVAAVPGPDKELTSNPKAYSDAFWGLRIAVAGLAEAVHQGAVQRSGKMESLIGKSVGGHVDGGLPRRELESVCMGALAENLFRLLIIAVESQPGVGLDVHRVIAAEAIKYLDRAVLDQFNADYLVAALRKAPERWEEYGELLGSTIDSVERLAVVKLVGLFEETDSADLRAFMEPLLRRRTHVTPKPQEVPELAEAFRRSLGVRSDETHSGRQRVFDTQVEQHFTRVQAQKDEPQALLNEFVQLIWIESLACALAQGDRGADTFRELTENPPSVSDELAMPSDPKPSWIGSPPSEPRRARNHIVRLGKSPKWFSRTEQISHLTALTEMIPDLAPLDARKLADYLLRLRPSRERDKVVPSLGKLGRWNQLRLAVADALTRHDSDPDWIRQLVQGLLDRELSAPIGTVPRVDDYRAELLASVLAPDEAAGSGRPKNLLDSCQQLLTDQYKVQLRLFGGSAVAPTEGRLATSDVIAQLLVAASRELKRRDLPGEQRQELAQISQQLEAINYYARDELHHTLLLERIWIRMLAMMAMTAGSGDTVEADRLLAELTESDEGINPAIAQLVNGHRAIARMWMLVNGVDRSAE